MQINGVGTGLAISVLLFIPIGLLDLLVAFNYYIGNWAVSSLILPYPNLLRHSRHSWMEGIYEVGEGLGYRRGGFLHTHHNRNLLRSSCRFAAPILSSLAEGHQGDPDVR